MEVAPISFHKKTFVQLMGAQGQCFILGKVALQYLYGAHEVLLYVDTLGSVSLFLLDIQFLNSFTVLFLQTVIV